MAMNAYRNYNNNTSSLSSNLEKLSSGYKINRAGDDAAGLAISEKMRAQISGLEQASSNVKDGISLVKTGEGAMQEIQDMLNRMTTLATQSANGTYDNETDRAQLQKEVDNLKSEINRIADSSNFNGINLLDGSLSGKSQVSGLAMSNTKAVAGQYHISTAFDDVTFSATKIATEDIGQSIDYTVTWTDSTGTDKTTKVSLTFQGKGDGTVGNTASTVDKNYFTDSNGTKYYLSTSGKLAKEDISKAVEAGLKADSEFNSAFSTIDLQAQSTLNGKQANQLYVEAADAGTSGAVLKSTALTSNFKTAALNTAASAAAGAGDAKVDDDFKARDSMQKFDVTGLKVLATGASAATIKSNTFEIDGHKFLVVDSTFTDTDIKALDSDITIIRAQTTGSTTGVKAQSQDRADIAAEISRVTGYATQYEDTAPGDDSGITTNDIMFTSAKLKLGGNELTLQIGDTAASYNQMGVKISDMHTAALGIDKIDISTQDGAAAAIDKIKAAINSVSSTRGDLGAVQNRLEHTANNLSVMTENIQDAESTIRDTDIAEEMMSYTKNNILVQSAQAMLAQANSVPQGVLQLLQ
jgi:flagellin